MELHTLGVDGGYTQRDVQEVARAFTGWTIDAPRQGGGFRYEPRMHDDGEKIVLGHHIKSGGGKHDGEQVLDILAKHPSTATFIATKLARRFVADTPPPSLVDRAATRFRETDGDIREVVRTIVTSPEFFAAAAYRAKVKTPFEFVASAVRTTGADATNPQPLVMAVRELGMPLVRCQPPTGYCDKRRGVGELRGAPQPYELRRIADAADGAGVRAARPERISSTIRDALVATPSPASSRRRRAQPSRRRRRPRRRSPWCSGSPEFQKR